MNDYYKPPSYKRKREAYKELAERLSWAGHHECGPTTEKDALAASSAIKELLCELERADIVRCKDCNRNSANNGGVGFQCTILIEMTGGSGIAHDDCFCSCGEMEG